MKNEVLIIRDIVSEMDNVRFIAGNWLEAVKDNSKLSFDKTKTKYPLIFMNLGYTSEYAEDVIRYSRFTTDFYFITNAELNDTPIQRLESTYKDILYPMFEDFCFRLFRSSKFVFDENIYNWRKMANEKQEMFYQPNVLNDIVDTLRVNLTLKLR